MTIYTNCSRKRIKPNTTVERRALKELRSNHSIIIKPSDKCKGFVVLDRESYIEKAKAILDDPDGYEKLNKDLTKQVEKAMTQLWRDTAADKVPQKLIYMMIPRHSRCAEWYGLPKDHKPLVPLRPIVSACDTPCERVSWLLERILHQLLKFVPAHLVNTEDFTNRLKQNLPEHLPPGALLFTMDVTALYSNIPVEEGIRMILRLLEDHEDDIDTLGFELNDIQHLLHFVLSNSYCRFGEDIYWQRMGVAIGNRLAPLFAILFMHDLESRFLATSPETSSIWVRYIDIFGV